MRKLTLLAVPLLIVGLLALPAAAHNLEINPPGNDKVVENWIGGPPGVVLPAQAQGQGLFDGPPSPPFPPDRRQPAAHGRGLVNACEATASNSVVTILGPGPTPCIHG